ncbi:MAG TPA: FkbM family methyltransferase [Brevundimonas sp.]|uniref:FkbM family methyltransferase n=1 Tax=Brevundimonas sp. TaxID=1871086 RepID=UPI002DE615DF|nr:FkbM family methyltransferase [Brevundimonas sp.]
MANGVHKAVLRACGMPGASAGGRGGGLYKGRMNARFLWRAHRARLLDQRPELSAIRRHVARDAIACDVGANKGSYMYWLSRWAARVVAFEPQPGLAAYLEQASRGLGLNNVTIEARGVSDRSGAFDFYLPSENSPEASLVPIAGARTVKVPVVTLDETFAAGERVGFLKVDVEGAELNVFRGAERILREDQPPLLFESEQRHLRDGSSVSDGFAFLQDRGYRGWFIHRGELKPVERFDPAVHQNAQGDRFWKSPDYANNFLFTPV